MSHIKQLNKFKGMNIIKGMFSNHKRTTLELKNRNISAKLSKYLEIDSWIKEEITKRIRKILT